MTAPAASPLIFRISAARAPGSRNGRAQFLWSCTGPSHVSWLLTTPEGETLGPFVKRCDAMEALQ